MEENLRNLPTSPDLPVEGDNITSSLAFSNAMTLDLTDDEIKQCMEIVVDVKNKYVHQFRSKFLDTSHFGSVSKALDDAMKMVSHFEDELKTRLAEDVNVLATVDMVPVLEGKPMQIEWIGVLPGGNLDKYGMDHEKKSYEVKRATDRDESFYGEKGTMPGAAKRRDERTRRARKN